MNNPERKEQLNLTIKRATPEDVIGMAEVRKQGWLSTYLNVQLGITREDLLSEDFETPERINGWQESLKKENICDLVAKDGDKVIGFAIGVKCDEFNAIKGLYVLPEFQGLGVGRELTEKILAWLGDDKPIKLNVAIYNENAIRFYEKNGFEKGRLVEITEDDKLACGKVIPEMEMVKKAK